MIGSVLVIAHGLPNRCTGTIALVRDVIFDSEDAGSRLNVEGSMSANTGVAPSRAIAPAAAKNENAGVITSSPGPMPRAHSAASNASLPDDTPTACAI